MKNDAIRNALDSIAPDEQAKERMLRAILAQRDGNEAEEDSMVKGAHVRTDSAKPQTARRSQTSDIDSNGLERDSVYTDINTLPANSAAKKGDPNWLEAAAEYTENIDDTGAHSRVRPPTTPAELEETRSHGKKRYIALGIAACLALAVGIGVMLQPAVDSATTAAESTAETTEAAGSGAKESVASQAPVSEEDVQAAAANAAAADAAIDAHPDLSYNGITYKAAGSCSKNGLGDELGEGTLTDDGHTAVKVYAMAEIDPSISVAANAEGSDEYYVYENTNVAG